MIQMSFAAMMQCSDICRFFGNESIAGACVHIYIFLACFENREHTSSIYYAILSYELMCWKPPLHLLLKGTYFRCLFSGSLPLSALWSRLRPSSFIIFAYWFHLYTYSDRSSEKVGVTMHLCPLVFAHNYLLHGSSSSSCTVAFPFLSRMFISIFSS